jgi:hypothetical protein
MIEAPSLKILIMKILEDVGASVAMLYAAAKLIKLLI